MSRPWRLGASWVAHNDADPEECPLVTIVEEGTGEPDEQGRRADDRLVGAMGRADAERVIEALTYVDMRHPVVTVGDLSEECGVSVGRIWEVLDAMPGARFFSEEPWYGSAWSALSAGIARDVRRQLREEGPA